MARAGVPGRVGMGAALAHAGGGRWWARFALPTLRCTFAEFACYVGGIPAPIGRQLVVRHVTVEAAVGPVDDLPYQPVFDRVEMNVVDVTGEVCIVADGVLPIAALPYPLLALADLAG